MKRFILALVVLFFALLIVSAVPGFTLGQSIIGQSIMTYMTNGEEFIAIYVDYDLKPGNENTNLYIELVQKAVIKKLKEINFRFPKKNSMGKWLEIPTYYPVEIGIIQKNRNVKAIITKDYQSEFIIIEEEEIHDPRNEPENLAEELIHKVAGCPPSHKMFK